MWNQAYFCVPVNCFTYHGLLLLCIIMNVETFWVIDSVETILNACICYTGHMVYEKVPNICS